MANQLVQLKDGNNNLYPNVFVGIDTNNVIASNITLPYTATQDCFAISSETGHRRLYLNGTEVQAIVGGADALICFNIIIKKGQVISTNDSASLTLYGLKYI